MIKALFKLFTLSLARPSQGHFLFVFSLHLRVYFPWLLDIPSLVSWLTCPQGTAEWLQSSDQSAVLHGVMPVNNNLSSRAELSNNVVTIIGWQLRGFSLVRWHFHDSWLVSKTNIQIGSKWQKFTRSHSQKATFNRMILLWTVFSQIGYINPSRSFHSHNPVLLHDCAMRWSHFCRPACSSCTLHSQSETPGSVV